MARTESERWRGVVAALLNDDLRAVLGETAPAAALTPARRERAIARLVDLGVVARAGDDVLLEASVLRELLATAPRPNGPERFLDHDGRIDRYPSHPGERRTFLEWVLSRTFRPGEVLTEPEVGERLAPLAPGGDVAVLRRYLVDNGLLERTRSGSQYAPVHAAQAGETSVA